MDNANNSGQDKDAWLRSSPVSLFALTIANLLPLLGVFFLHWDLASILIVYWLDNTISCFFAVLSAMFDQRPPEVASLLWYSFKVIFVPIYFLQCAFVCFVHGTLLSVMLFLPEINALHPSFFTPIHLLWQHRPSGLFALSFIIAHGISFWGQRRRGSEPACAADRTDMYRRSLIFHVSLLFGGWLVLLTRQRASLVLGIVLILVKTIVDVRLRFGRTSVRK